MINHALMCNGSLKSRLASSLNVCVLTMICEKYINLAIIQSDLLINYLGPVTRTVTRAVTSLVVGHAR